MSVLAGFSRDRGVQRQIDPPWLPWDHGGLSPSVVSAATAFGLDVAWSCVTRICDTIAGLPVDVFTRTADTRVPVEPLPMVVGRPQPDRTRREWVWGAAWSMAWWGNTYGRITAVDRLGFPETVDLWHPDKVTVDRFAGFDRYRFEGREVDPDQVMHLRRYPTPGDAKSPAPLETHKLTFRLAAVAKSYAADWFDNGAHPTAIFSDESGAVIPNDDVAEKVKTRIRHALRRRGEPLVLSRIKYTPVQLGPDQAGFTGTEEKVGLAVCRVFNTPPERVGLAATGSSITYANRVDSNTDHLQQTCGPWMAPFEDWWNDSLPARQRAKFNADSYLRADTKTRADIASSRIRSGTQTVNEARMLEDEPPVDGGDVTLWPPFRAFKTTEDEEG